MREGLYDVLWAQGRRHVPVDVEVRQEESHEGRRVSGGPLLGGPITREPVGGFCVVSREKIVSSH